MNLKEKIIFILLLQIVFVLGIFSIHCSQVMAEDGEDSIKGRMDFARRI